MHRAPVWFAVAAGFQGSLVGCSNSTWPGNATAALPSVFPLLENVDSADLFPMPLCGSFDLHEATIDQMQAAMEAGTLTSQQLVACYMQRTYQTQEYIQ